MRVVCAPKETKEKTWYFFILKVGQGNLSDREANQVEVQRVQLLNNEKNFSLKKSAESEAQTKSQWKLIEINLCNNTQHPYKIISQSARRHQKNSEIRHRKHFHWLQKKAEYKIKTDFIALLATLLSLCVARKIVVTLKAVRALRGKRSCEKLNFLLFSSRRNCSSLAREPPFTHSTGEAAAERIKTKCLGWWNSFYLSSYSDTSSARTGEFIIHFLARSWRFYGQKK